MTPTHTVSKRSRPKGCISERLERIRDPAPRCLSSGRRPRVRFTPILPGRVSMVRSGAEPGEKARRAWPVSTVARRPTTKTAKAPVRVREETPAEISIRRGSLYSTKDTKSVHHESKANRFPTWTLMPKSIRPSRWLPGPEWSACQRDSPLLYHRDTQVGRPRRQPRQTHQWMALIESRSMAPAQTNRKSTRRRRTRPKPCQPSYETPPSSPRPRQQLTVRMTISSPSHQHRRKEIQRS